MLEDSPKDPEKSFRLGNVSASVFKNQTESGRDFRSVVLQRSYMTEGGERRFSSSFNAADLPVLQRLLQLAQEHVEQIEVLIDDVAEK